MAAMIAGGICAHDNAAASRSSDDVALRALRIADAIGAKVEADEAAAVEADYNTHKAEVENRRQTESAAAEAARKTADDKAAADAAKAPAAKDPPKTSNSKS